MIIVMSLFVFYFGNIIIILLYIFLVCEYSKIMSFFLKLVCREEGRYNLEFYDFGVFCCLYVC